MKNTAPIALFAYNRLDHIRRTLEALRKNELATVSELYVFSDGPRSEADQEKVRAVRELIRTISGFHTVTIIEQEANRGLARSIIDGVTTVVEKHGQVIVLEDDMITSPYFLRYMNEALHMYRNDERVISIHGYIYPIETLLPETFFLKGADCWGWATWKRGWNLFEPDGLKLLHELRTRNLARRFDFDGTYGYTSMLESQVNGLNDSWAIRWYASAFLKDKVTLYPGRSLVCNIGVDASGTHCGAWDKFDAAISAEPVRVVRIPSEENRIARKAFKAFFRSLRPPLRQRIRSRITRIMGGAR